MTETVVGTEELVRKFETMGNAAKGQALVTAMKAGGLVILNAIKGNIQKQGLIRTRTLSRSVHEEVVEQTETRAVIEDGTNLEYAAIHEFGGVITAKQGKYLAIPVGDYTGSPRKYSDLRPLKTKGGALVLVNSSGTVEYVLKTSVEIPARPYMRPALDEKKEAAVKEVGDVLRNQILEATRK